MLTLLIDNKPAVLKAGTSFKLTRENPYFASNSGGGDYTLDVLLPLAGCPQNQAVFGPLHRPEAPRRDLAGLRMHFRLLAPPLEKLEGTAVVTAVQDDCVKLQLRAGNSELRLHYKDERGRDIRLFDLDLGRAWDTDFARLCPGKTYGQAALLEMFWRNMTDTAYLIDGSKKGTDGYFCDCAMLPILAAGETPSGAPELRDERTLHVGFKYGPTGKPETAFYYELPGYANRLPFFVPPGDPDAHGYDDFINNVVPSSGVYADYYGIAPQPRLYVLLERVLRAIGHPVDPADDVLRQPDHPFSKLIYANARRTFRYAEMLPGWTAEEFVGEVERFCGVRVCVDGRGHTAIVRKKDYYAQPSATVELRRVADGVDCEVDGSRQEDDITLANVRYAFANAPHAAAPLDGEAPAALALTDDVLSRSGLHVCDDWREAMTEFNAMDLEERRAAILSLPKQPNGELCYVFCGQYQNIGERAGAAPYGPLMRDALAADTFTELRIVPADGFHPNPSSIGEDTYADPLQPGAHLSIYEWDNNNSYYAKKSDSFIAPFLLRTLLSADYETGAGYSVHDALKRPSATQPDPEEERPKVMEVALAGFKKLQKITAGGYPDVLTTYSSHAVGIAYQADDSAEDTLYTEMADTSGSGGSPETLALNNGSSAIVSEALAPDAFSATSKTETRLSFADNLPPRANLDAVYLIRGRRHACRKLELTIDENGLQPLKTGYFLEMND